MKKLLSITILFFSTFIFSQTQDLYSLAKGDYIGFNALFDEDENLYGYVAIYGYGKSGDKTKKFEYVILDKNLNPVANKEFEGDITAGDYFGYIDFNKKIILAPTSLDDSYVKSKEIFTPRSMEIDPSKNTINYKIYYDYVEGKFNEIAQPKTWKEEKKENRVEKREKGYNYFSDVVEIKEGGYLVIEYHDYYYYNNQNKIIRYNEQKEKLWESVYNTNGEEKNNEALKIIKKDDENLYCFVKKTEKKKDAAYEFLVISMKTGKEIKRMPFELPYKYTTLDELTDYRNSFTYSPNNLKTFDDKIVLLTNYFNKNKFYLGIKRTLIDKKNLEINFKNLYYEEDFKKFIPNIGRFGVVEKGYVLTMRDFYFLRDGSVGILMEKYKPQGDYSAPKTTDLVYAFTDKDFNLKDVKVFEKEKTKWETNSDYLFSQYLNEGKDVVFFYRDLQKDEKTKEKNWNLYINTLIDGQFKQEKVQISEKDNFTVIPYIAKEGYILLREFNEKEKFNKVRLERLNY